MNKRQQYKRLAGLGKITSLARLAWLERLNTNKTSFFLSLSIFLAWSVSFSLKLYFFFSSFFFSPLSLSFSYCLTLFLSFLLPFKHNSFFLPPRHTISFSPFPFSISTYFFLFFHELFPLVQRRHFSRFKHEVTDFSSFHFNWEILKDSIQIMKEITENFCNQEPML